MCANRVVATDDTSLIMSRGYCVKEVPQRAALLSWLYSLEISKKGHRKYVEGDAGVDCAARACELLSNLVLVGYNSKCSDLTARAMYH